MDISVLCTMTSIITTFTMFDFESLRLTNIHFVRLVNYQASSLYDTALKHFSACKDI